MIGRDEVVDVEGTRVLNMSGTLFNHVNARLAASSEFKRTNVQEPGLCAVASSSPDFNPFSAAGAIALSAPHAQ